MLKLVAVLYAGALLSSAQGGAAVIPLAYSVPSVSYGSSVVHGVGYAAPTVYAARAVSLAPQSPAVVLGPGGVPLDTPEVVAARAQHFQAKALAGSGLIYTPYSPAAVVLGPGGVPLDTPEVVAARAQHFQAKALAVSGVHSLRKRSIPAPAAVSYSAPLVSTYSAYSAPVASTYSAYGAPVASIYSGYAAAAAPVVYTAGNVFPSQAYSTYNIHPY